MASKEPSFHAREALREVLNGATIRAIANIQDTGEALVARVKNLLGGDHINTEGDKDVMVHFEDIMQGFGNLARLFIPMNMLWNAPGEGDSCMVIKGRNARSPGAPYLLFGDAGAAIPDWLRTKAGLWINKILRIQSTNNDVEIECGSGKKIKLGDGATKGVARLDDTTTNGTIEFLTSSTNTILIKYTAPDGNAQSTTLNFTIAGGAIVITTLFGGSANINGKINSASAKIIAE